MYRDSYQRGLLTIFFSCGSKPLNIWETCTKNGYITKLLDEDIRSTVLEIGGTNVSTTYMICPRGKQVLGVTMPFLVMIVKNMKKYFSFEVTVLDDTGTRRRFRVSNFQSTTQILPLCTVMPIALSDGWNQIQFNMSDFCRRAYKKQFVEVQKFKINANIRIRRIYFADRIFAEDQLPAEYKLFIPLKKRPVKDEPKKDDDAVEKAPSAELKKTDSKLASASKVEAATEEKRSSKVLDEPKVPAATAEEPVLEGKALAAEGTEPVAEGTEPVAEGAEPVAEGAEPVAEGAEPVAEGAEPVAEGAEPVDATEEAPATAEGGPEPGDAEEPVTEAQASATEDVATETEPVRETSVDAATQYETGDGPVDKATDPAEATEEKTQSAARLETIAETE